MSIGTGIAIAGVWLGIALMCFANPEAATTVAPAGVLATLFIVLLS